MESPLLKNFKIVSDDDVVEIFSYPNVADGVFCEGLFYGDRRMRNEDTIDAKIYEILEEIEK